MTEIHIGSGSHLPPPQRPVGAATRGTTHPNRLRRVDRWLTALHGPRLRRAVDPLVVDLGYGRHPVTTVELSDRLVAEVRSDVDVVGVEIVRERVAEALAFERPGLAFVRGGFNLPIGVRRPVVIRAMNVLRQYTEAEALDAWRVLCAQLDADGVLVEGTCDEIGRRCTWVALDRSGPRTLTFAVRPDSLERPGDLADRLPKALIHHNVPGDPVHAFLAQWDAAWARSSGGADGSPRTRWVEAAAHLLTSGRRVARNPARWRLGELTVAWPEVGPHL